MTMRSSRMTERDEHCPCMATGPERSETTSVGVDDTDGRYASVNLDRCPACGRLWLRYAVAYEAFTASGRWATCLISEMDAATITPETAAKYIDAPQPWHVFGGSYYGHAGERCSGRLRWDL